MTVGSKTASRNGTRSRWFFCRIATINVLHFQMWLVTSTVCHSFKLAFLEMVFGGISKEKLAAPQVWHHELLPRLRHTPQAFSSARRTATAQASPSPSCSSFVAHGHKIHEPLVLAAMTGGMQVHSQRVHDKWWLSLPHLAARMGTTTGVALSAAMVWQSAAKQSASQ